MGARKHQAVSTDNHRLWLQQLLQVNQGNTFLVFPAPAFVKLLSHFHLFRDLNETKIRETSANDKKWLDCG